LPKIPYRAFPAVKIGQLAVDANFQKQKVGSTLISLAIALAKEHVQPRIGCRLLIVDSHKDAVPFYRGKGFIVVASGKEKKFPVMFLDIGKL
jgi:GNAT superfamily N-acetyltransferase